MSLVNGVFTRSFYIHGYDVDHNSNLRPSSLLSMMHETAWSHVNVLQLGWQDLQKLGLFWALSKVHLKVHRMPKWCETITIETWARDKASVMFLREYRAYDEAGLLLAEVSSEWILIDAIQQKITRTDRLGTQLESPERPIFSARVPRIPKLQFPEGTLPRQVLLTDLDMNLHVNNASYVRWMMNQFPYEFYNQHSIDEIVVNYLLELKPDTEYFLAMERVGELTFQTTIFNKEQKESCKLSVSWKK